MCDKLYWTLVYLKSGDKFEEEFNSVLSFGHVIASTALNTLLTTANNPENFIHSLWFPMTKTDD